jgi:hypothetical protein
VKGKGKEEEGEQKELFTERRNGRKGERGQGR